MPRARISKIGFENYKAFADPEQLEVRPLTLLFGRNGSGKSAVARLPEMLFGQGRVRDVPGVALGSGDLHFGAAYEDLVHGRFRDRLKVSVDIAAEANVRVEVAILPAAKTGAGSPLQLVERLSIHMDDRGWRWTAESHDQGGYHVTVSDADGAVLDQVRPLDFHGIFPSERLIIADRALVEFMARHTRAHPVVDGLYTLRPDHLGPTRVPLPALWPTSDRPASGVGVCGEGATALLVDPRTGIRSALVDVVSAWFARIGWECKVEQSLGPGGAPLYSLAFRRSGTATWVGASLLGTGFRQVFPVVVQQFALQLGLVDPAVAVVEEPESHLHPAAHAVLADLFIETSNRPETAPVIVETHSEVLLLRVRRWIAERRLDPARVALHFVDDLGPAGTPAKLRLLEIGADGWVDGWPDGIFEEDAQERSALARAMRDHA